jgi:hypothetical protein
MLGSVSARQQAFRLLDDLPQGLLAHEVGQQAQAGLGHPDAAGLDQRLRRRIPELGDGVALEIDDPR